MATATQYYYALGRRKSATARVRLQKGSGNITVNGKPVSEYLADSKALLHDLQRPFATLELPLTDYDVSVVVDGGGHGDDLHHRARLIEVGDGAVSVEADVANVVQVQL